MLMDGRTVVRTDERMENWIPIKQPEFRGERCRTCPRVGGVCGGGHRCNINFIVLYGMCSHSLYIKGEN